MLAHILDRAETGLIIIEVPDPAPGANMQWIDPEYTNVMPVSIEFTFTTAAGGSSRHVQVAGRRGGLMFCHSPAPNHQDASIVTNYGFALCVLGLDKQTDHQFQTAPLSGGLVLTSHEEFITDIFNIQSSDQITDIHLRYLQKMPR